MKLITDGQSLKGATSRFGRPIPTYDDGYGPLWIHKNSMGIPGIVRAMTWEDAYGICENEFFPAADTSEEELVKEFGENYYDNGCFQEQYGYRGNARKETDGSMSVLYEKDLNGDSLDSLTHSLLAELEITLDIGDPQENPSLLFGPTGHGDKIN